MMAMHAARAVATSMLEQLLRYYASLRHDKCTQHTLHTAVRKLSLRSTAATALAGKSETYGWETLQ